MIMSSFSMVGQVGLPYTSPFSKLINIQNKIMQIQGLTRSHTIAQSMSCIFTEAQSRDLTSKFLW